LRNDRAGSRQAKGRSCGRDSQEQRFQDRGVYKRRPQPTDIQAKTRLKNRGYTEKVLPQPQPEQAPAQPTLPEPQIVDGEKIAATIQRKISSKKTYIVKLLKQQGKYTPELSMQVKIVAQLLVRTEILAEQIFDAGHKPVNVEISREGNERESISPKEKLYLDLLQQSQKALRALGMNTDSRERKTDNDGFNEFMEQFKNDADD